MLQEFESHIEDSFCLRCVGKVARSWPTFGKNVSVFQMFLISGPGWLTDPQRSRLAKPFHLRAWLANRSPTVSIGQTVSSGFQNPSGSQLGFENHMAASIDTL
ncbi:hypothetical protein Pst134EA_007564 [Puccinia striiformis f. sp. tritici]|uniref:hypothetical protein n=1 Tax=Puccinia striiformis f. sp. tritici TaxID=168172 RepID=UPI002007ED10|nr:hypothetical protein Pst134EA_007564 [Puccinia striiformis f. sp. tritici]KAH9470299.1 hypothetical protein Pst134EA_007564 [Puccinia striiformis f. sp. tritici]